MSESVSKNEAIGSFIDKWRARWPEWAIAEVFVPREHRDPAVAWMALLQELTDAAWGGSDPRPGEAKLGWWAEELHGWPRGIRRHPLGQVLQKFPVAWGQLAGSLSSLPGSRERPVDVEDAFAQLRGFAETVAVVEQALFGGSAPDAVGVVTLGLLHQRLAHHPGDAAPLQVLAQAGEGTAIAEWTRQLASRFSTRSGATQPRRLLAALAQARLRRGEAVRPVPALPALWATWRAARG
ncbi:phytoene/squalene synthase family protein [Lysobacter niabensis]|uniref:phytoene/squalene synthase family protein n=1 Tax=Agrilutibacter niabensis TaxID=380628 RepID=UPI00361D85EB